uniref:Uncharacterized protein n=1 Tax=Rhizophora mucronata TaxID=61149 RepID=A0A2P2R397_RHIMU
MLSLKSMEMKRLCTLLALILISPLQQSSCPC